MPQTCKTCCHPDRAAIDEAILAGEPNRRIASRCDVSEAAIRRHASHVPATVALAARAAEETRGDGLLAILHEAKADARRLRDRAEKEGDLRCAVAAVKTLCDVVERLASVAEKLAKSGEAAPIRVEYVNDWRAPVGLIQGEPDA
jgi:hypothetical protein